MQYESASTEGCMETLMESSCFFKKVNRHEDSAKLFQDFDKNQLSYLVSKTRFSRAGEEIHQNIKSVLKSDNLQQCALCLKIR